MRIPGTRRLESRLVRAFEINDRDRRVLTRGVRDVKSGAVGAASAFLAAGGNPFTDPKGAAAFFVGSAVAAMHGKKTREQIGHAAENGGTDDA